MFFEIIPNFTFSILICGFRGGIFQGSFMPATMYQSHITLARRMFFVSYGRDDVKRYVKTWTNIWAILLCGFSQEGEKQKQENSKFQLIKIHKVDLFMILVCWTTENQI